ncbi:hypothetical protein ACTVZO_40915 [Streptomyces sp. IBSNAI002]|uniref:hypothetical protein n=1 Tax=Streptomyces sp. IBSNAI002 TaxID=3457500 RepID=UPI003FD20199
MQATNTEFACINPEVFISSDTNDYRSGLMQLLGVLDFRSCNDRRKPVMEALKLTSDPGHLPAARRDHRAGGGGVHGLDVVRDLHPGKGPTRVMRTVYGACVFQALRERLS